MEDILMSTKEADRCSLLKAYSEGKLSLKVVSTHMGLSYRQAKRLWQRYEREGAKGVLSKRRGKPSNHSIPFEIKQEILQIIERDYSDFGPTLAREYLEKEKGYKVSKETIRQLMIKELLWFPKRIKMKLHRRRPRREQKGEMVLMDGSSHKWLEDRGPECTLHLIIDDATSEIMSGYFALEECTEGYMRTCKKYFSKEGLPRSIYTDRHGIFRVNKGKEVKQRETQFGRAMRELDIKMIYAHSPQAKGRIERANGTLQDRLIKEMRLQRINTLEEANNFLPTYIKDYNKKFGQPPINPVNAHRPLDHRQNLDTILCIKESRIVNKELEISYRNEIYQIDRRTKDIRGGKVDVITTLEGDLILENKGVRLDYSKYREIRYEERKPVLGQYFAERSTRLVPLTHPWKHPIRESVCL